MNVREAKKSLAAANKQAEEARKVIEEAKRHKILKCKWCKKGTKVKNLTLYVEHYYVRPYSCTGGDYWRESGLSFDCPKCGETNTAHKQDDGFSTKSYSREDIPKLRRYFKDQQDRYDD